METKNEKPIEVIMTKCKLCKKPRFAGRFNFDYCQGCDRIALLKLKPKIK